MSAKPTSTQLMERRMEWINSIIVDTRIRNRLTRLFSEDDKAEDHISSFSQSTSWGFVLSTTDRNKIKKLKKEIELYDGYGTFFDAFCSHSEAKDRTLGKILTVLEELDWKSMKGKVLTEDWTKHGAPTPQKSSDVTDLDGCCEPEELSDTTKFHLEFTSLAKLCLKLLRNAFKADGDNVEYNQTGEGPTPKLDTTVAVGAGALTGAAVIGITGIPAAGTGAGKVVRDLVQKCFDGGRAFFGREKVKKRYAAFGPCEKYQGSRDEVFAKGVVLFLSLYEAQIHSLISKETSRSTIFAKIAQDLTRRVQNYALSMTPNVPRTATDVIKACLLGRSKRERRLTLKTRHGKTLTLDDELEWKSGNMFDKVGLILKNGEVWELKEGSRADKYGCRKIAEFEEGDERIAKLYEKSENPNLNNYEYQLDADPGILKNVVHKILKDFKCEQNLNRIG